MMSSIIVEKKSNIESDNLKKETQIIFKLKTALEAAYFNHQYDKQCDILAKLADHYLRQKNYSVAAKLWNGAIAICQTHRQDIKACENLEKGLLEQLKQIEHRFVEEQLGVSYQAKSPEQQGINFQHKKSLIELRDVVKKRLEKLPKSSNLLDEDSAKEIQELSKWISQSISRFLDEIIKDCIYLMQKEPPCDYALVGTGSLAREEMTPYSDLECFMLIAEDAPEHKQYFSHLSQLLELRIINLGETDLAKGETLLPIGMLSPVQKGFSLDVHKTPNNSTYSQIGTPVQIAQYQLPEWYVNEPANHLSLALLNVRYITGTNQGRNLLASYQKNVDEILKLADLNTQKSLRLTRSLSALEDDIDRFEPKLGQEDEGRLFQVKEDFYRLPQTIIDALALHQDLKCSSTWDRIDELCVKQFMPIEAGQRLKQVLSQANEWRLKTYSHYNMQREMVDVLVRLSTTAAIGSNRESKHRGLSDDDIKILTEAYKILISLHKCTKHFYEIGDTQNPFINDLLYDDSLFMAGTIASRLYQYIEAKRLFELELKIYEIEKNPEKILKAALLNNRIGKIYFILGDGKKAIEYFEKELTITINIYGVEHLDIAVAYSNLGGVWQALGNNKKAMEYHEKALKMRGKFYSLEHPKIATSYNNLGTVWQALGDGKKAIEYFENALEILIKIYGLEYPKIATIYNNLGVAWQVLGDGKKAIGYHEKSLKIRSKIYGFGHSEVAMSYNNLGVTHEGLGEPNKAKVYYEIGLTINLKIYSFEHPNVANCYNNLGGVWQRLGDAKRAIEYFEKALLIYTKVHGFEHPDVAKCYNNLGGAWQRLGDAKKAIEYCEKALLICTKVHGLEHPEVATSYGNLGTAWQALGDGKKAIVYFEKALVVDTKVYGPEHPNIGTSHKDLGTCWQALGDVKKAMESYRQALTINLKVYGPAHPDVATSYNDLGLAWQELGDGEKAIEHHEKALTINLKVYGPAHPNVATNYNNLGASWQAIGDGKKAIEYHEKSLSILTKVYGSVHPHIAACYNNLGESRRILGDSKEAIRCYEEALTILIKIYSPQHPNIAASYNNLGMAWQALRDAIKAVEYFEKALAILTQSYGFEHQHVAITYNNLGVTLQNLGDISESVKYYEKSLKILNKIYNSTHPYVVSTLSKFEIASALLRKKEESKKITNQNPNNITIPFMAGSSDYIRRLQFILGKDIVQIREEENSVSLPLLWLRQLGNGAINELSTELKTGFQKFLNK